MVSERCVGRGQRDGDTVRSMDGENTATRRPAPYPQTPAFYLGGTYQPCVQYQTMTLAATGDLQCAYVLRPDGVIRSPACLPGPLGLGCLLGGRALWRLGVGPG